MERFEFNKKQKVALDRFEKAAAALAKARVTLLVDSDEHQICALPLSKHDDMNLELWDGCDIPLDLEENDFEDVTADVEINKKIVDICAAYTDSETVFAIVEE